MMGDESIAQEKKPNSCETEKKLRRNPLSIHFILPGGGVKGCFQAGFLHRLNDQYNNLFTTHRIDGTSVGSLNGFAMATHNLDKLKEVWLSIKNIKDLFHSTSSWRVKTLMDGYYQRGMFDNSRLFKKICLAGETNMHDPDLQKFNCVVMEIENGFTYYINGTNPKIKDYVLASSSPWIITKPQTIDGFSYTDGGLLENFPISYCNASKADLKVLVGYDQTYEDLKSDGTENIFAYLQSLIDISRREHYKKVTDAIKKSNIVTVPCGVQTDFVNFSPDIIKNGFIVGEFAADEFAATYLSNVTEQTTATERVE